MPIQEPSYHTVTQSTELSRFRKLNNYPEGQYMIKLDSPVATIETLAERDGLVATYSTCGSCSSDIEFRVGNTIVGIESRVRLVKLPEHPDFVLDNISILEKYGLIHTFIYKYLIYIRDTKIKTITV